MNSNIALQDLLVIEDDPGLLQFCCAETRVPLWPSIRNQFFRFAMSDALFSSPLVEQRRGTNLRRNVSGATIAVARAVAHNTFHQRELNGPVLLTTGGAGLFLKGGRWFNRLTDYFALAQADDTVILEDLFKWQWRYPRYFERVLFHTPFFLRGYWSGKLCVQGRHIRAAEALIGLVRTRALRLIDWELGDVRAAFLIQLLARESAAMPMLSRAYEKLLTRMNTRIVIKEMGCYGRSSVFNATARGMGLTVAEHQHGMVSSGHDAYNLAPSLARSREYRRTLPEFFLSYGAWWTEQISVPVTAIAVGNPHRTEKLREFDRCAPEKIDVLILGDGIETRSYLQLACALAKKIASPWRVVFRPHPLERERMPAGDLDGVHIDRRLDIYESFSSAHVVVSEASTGLFEAVGLADRIFVRETARGRFSLPRHPFVSCRDVDDLAQKIADDSLGYPDTSDTDRVWAPGWCGNYLKFLRGQIEPGGKRV